MPTSFQHIIISQLSFYLQDISGTLFLYASPLSRIPRAKSRIPLAKLSMLPIQLLDIIRFHVRFILF